MKPSDATSTVVSTRASVAAGHGLVRTSFVGCSMRLRSPARSRGRTGRSRSALPTSAGGTPARPSPGGRREGSRSPCRGRAPWRPGSARAAEVGRHLAADALATSSRAFQMPSGRAVRLRRGRQVDDRLGQVELRLGQAHELDRPRRGVGHHERHRVGHADVLAGQDHEPAGDEARVLPRLEHAGEPVEAGIGVRPADALDERADDVVVVVFAVAQGLVPMAASASASVTCGARSGWRVRGQGDGDLEVVRSWRPSPSRRGQVRRRASWSAVAPSASRPRSRQRR